ncbi:MAG: hypothetical protein EBY83_09005 [Verrucomicrobia bacterium]|nr:hypothetical protein [Verrucomicrobiota bacterium]
MVMVIKNIIAMKSVQLMVFSNIIRYRHMVTAVLWVLLKMELIAKEIVDMIMIQLINIGQMLGNAVAIK